MDVKTMIHKLKDAISKAVDTHLAEISPPESVDLSLLKAILDVTVDEEIRAFEKFTRAHDKKQGIHVATAVAAAVRATVSKWNHLEVGQQLHVRGTVPTIRPFQTDSSKGQAKTEAIVV